MTPLQFEQLHEPEWTELEALLKQLKGSRKNRNSLDGHRLAQLYRRACEQLAMARERAYPVYQIDRLQQLTADAHQVIYRQHEVGLERLGKLFMIDFPCTVRAHAVYVWIATLVFVVPTLVMGVLVYYKPELILSVVDAEQASRFAQMYSDSADNIGRMREADGDWQMFGFYIKNNIGISFQCFASGLFAGIGSLFFLAFNGILGGAIAGHLTHLGLSRTFYSFVVTHGAFELTAIVLSGAAGLRLGHALLAPKNLSRVQSLVTAARESIVIVYGVILMLLIAAAIEAFWSSQRWIPLPMKYSVAAICWAAVLSYLTLQGRGHDHAG